MVYHYGHHYSAQLHASKRILYIFLVAEATVHCMIFRFYSHFDVASLLSTSVLDSGTLCSSVVGFAMHRTYIMNFCGVLSLLALGTKPGNETFGGNGS